VGREYIDDWVSSNIANWLEWLGHLIGRAGVAGLEIGSYEGRSACWFLDHVLTDPSSRLTCIDPWYDQSRRQRFEASIADTGRAMQVGSWQDVSRKVLHFISDQSLDFAYIDGSHEARDVLADGLAVLPLLKPGGVMIFDDYEWDKPDLARVRPGIGVDCFLAVTVPAGVVEVVGKGYQVAVRRVG
jgi:predicted O-methyltransferase YrrM